MNHPENICIDAFDWHSFRAVRISCPRCGRWFGRAFLETEISEDAVKRESVRLFASWDCNPDEEPGFLCSYPDKALIGAP